VNYQKLQKNRYAKTSFLLREDAFESIWERTKVVLPLQAVSLFRRLAPWPFLGSVAGALTARPLLIQIKVYHEL
jgi:hypothetical protein